MVAKEAKYHPAHDRQKDDERRLWQEKVISFREQQAVGTTATPGASGCTACRNVPGHVPAMPPCNAPPLFLLLRTSTQ